MDAQSVKNTATTENKGYDAGKKNLGIKRHLAVDINGFPQAIYITRANISDQDGTSAMLALHAHHLRQVQSVLVDGGYSGVNFRLDVARNLNAVVQVAKHNELHRFEVMSQRWLVERSFSWLKNCRRFWKNCERQLTTSLQMVVLAFLALLLKDFRQLLKYHGRSHHCKLIKKSGAKFRYPTRFMIARGKMTNVLPLGKMILC